MVGEARRLRLRQRDEAARRRLHRRAAVGHSGRRAGAVPPPSSVAPTPEQVAAIARAQSCLAQLGYYKGEVDGKRGKETWSAYWQFKHDHDLDAYSDLLAEPVQQKLAELCKQPTRPLRRSRTGRVLIRPRLPSISMPATDESVAATSTDTAAPGRQIEDVITKTLESMPANSTHWSTRLMAQEAGLTQNAIVRIWRAFGLQPHRVENFKFSKDPAIR